MTPPSLDPTGERLLPEHYRGQLVHAEHLARYRLAAQLAAGRRVLDCACGEGYGSAMLAAAGADSVTSVDVDAETVEHVRERHGVEAVAADVRELPFPDDAFDLVVSFETIEHVQDPERALDELARVCARGGHLLISTPNASQYLVQNEFHVREFGHDEFVALLEARFPSVRLLYQHNWLTSAILEQEDLGEDDGARRLALELTKVHPLRRTEELYLVALCGDATDAKLAQTGVMAGTDEAHLLAHRLDDALATQAQLARERDAAAATARWMGSTWSWRLTKPLRLAGRLRRRRDL